MSLVHYIIVRRDLPLGVMAAMVTHAAGESGAIYRDPLDGRFRGATAVVLGAKNQDAILDALVYMDKKNIQHVAVVESGAPYDGQFMAIGIVPGNRDKLGPLMAEFQVLKALDIPADREENTTLPCEKKRSTPTNGSSSVPGEAQQLTLSWEEPR